VRETVGIFGATGYTGRELARLVSLHPSLRLAFRTGKGHLEHEAGLGKPAKAYFLCLPHGVSGRFAGELRRTHPDSLIVDLSGDLRLPTEEAYRTWYGAAHPAPDLLGTAPYGLTEVFRGAIRGARLVSNPGCYATSALLPLLPLVKEGLVDARELLVDSKSGASGAGRTPREELLFCEVAEDLRPYSPGRAHRHVGEMEAVLLGQTSSPVGVVFCPHLLPVKRGILSSCYVKTDASAEDVAGFLRGYYEGSPFVRVVAEPPHLSHVVFTNNCHMSVHAGTVGRIVIFSALDNLVKGAAGQAIQNLNVAFGWEETLGLLPGGED
jgi:N-acetyl-gamma-glutamyl-phosphate reductase